jgi:hypothetical protein
MTPDWDEDYREHNSNLDGDEEWLGNLEAEVEEARSDYKEYIFTFGVGHKLVTYLPEMHNAVEPQEGFSLAGYYVKISATNETDARVLMIRRWGHNWSSCYRSDLNPVAFDNAIAKYKELKIE